MELWQIRLLRGTENPEELDRYQLVPQHMSLCLTGKVRFCKSLVWEFESPRRLKKD